jgi:hypothetical protein
MVTAVRKPISVQKSQVQEVETQSPIGVEATAPRSACPRCSARVFTGYYEPECLKCGWVDYEFQAPETKQQSILGSATRYILRYVGEFAALSETLAHVKVVRLRNRAVYGVVCPFCTKPMAQTSLSGKRREVREQRYECGLGHRVSLTPAKSGSLGWK